MTLSRLLLLPVCLSALLLAGCPTDGRRDSYDYLRSPVTFRIDPVDANHPFCSDPVKRYFGTEQECVNARKYRLRWERPEDTVGFSEYRIFVDTTPPNAPGVPWTELRKERASAQFLMAGRPSAADSIIFVLTPGGGSAPDENLRSTQRILALDTTGRIDSLGKLVFAIVTAYRESGQDGQPRYTWVITNDRFAPYPLQPAFTPKSRSLELAWSRPGDPTSFFDPTADSGVIRGYVVRIVRGGLLSGPNGQGTFHPVLTYYGAGGVNRTAEVDSSSFLTARRVPGRRFWLPDSHRVVNRDAEDFRDSIRVTVEGLSPLDTVDVSVWAVDVENNVTDSTLVTRVLLTDTTQPTTPTLSLVEGSVTRNGFAYTFQASRDLVESGGGLAPAGAPNANILEYHLSRRRIGGSAGGTASVDSVFKLNAVRALENSFTDTVRYLPPGAFYRIYVQAIDSTGHASARDSLDVGTPAIRFPGADSLAACPGGFIPIPAGSFYLGDSTPSFQDEVGARHTLGSYCIEPYEHRLNTVSDTFQTRVTWEQARDVCAALPGANEPHLCTEPEWERACEGTDSVPLVYGVQSERVDPAGVRYTCNIGTNDSAVAKNLSRRDPSCLSYDGVFDMAGNYAEWVLDPYDTASYALAPEPLVIGQPLTAPTSSSKRGFRGSHYLNSNQTPAVLLGAARCDNRDYATQVRPKPWPGCTDSLHPMLAVIYAPVTTGVPRPPRCFALPDSLIGRNITSVAPARDTNQILILLQGQTSPVVYVMPLGDTAYYKNQKPIAAQLTLKSLAIVTFDNSVTMQSIVDTLDAAEMQNASEAGLTAIFNREAAPPWSVRKVNGQYAIRYLYAYTHSQGIPAKANYSNKVIGFRCCSKPVQPLGKRASRR